MTWSCDWLKPPTPADAAERAWSPEPVQVLEAAIAVEPEAPEPAEECDASASEAAEHAARAEAAALQEQLRIAYEDGRADGAREANALAAGRVQSALQALNAACEQLAALREPWQREAHAHVAALATAIAHQVIEREVRTDPGIIADLVRQALALFPLGEPVRIHVHPEDLSALSLNRAAGELRLAPGRQAEWVADETVARGGCLVEGPRRVVDGRTQHVLQRIYEALIHA